MGRSRATHEEIALAVESERKRASVRSLDFSFNELADMYRTSEIKISPDYQRLFRWDTAKQSQFIESIILEMPIPPIYMVEVKEDQWDLIDGLQRLSTYLHFRGELDLPDHEPEIKKGVNFLELTSCDIVPQLNGIKFSDLTTSMQHRVRRATLRVELVRRERNPRFAYHMFKRLNTGGEVLSNQETRNCSIRLLGDSFVVFSGKMLKDVNFLTCIEDITDEYRSRMGGDELILRFFAFKNRLVDYVHDIDPFLTWFLERVTEQSEPDSIPFDFTAEEQVFRKTFKIIAKTLGAKAFSRYSNGKPAGGFAMGHYEAFSIGMARVLDMVSDDPDVEETEKIKQALLSVKNDPSLRDLTVGGGKNFRRIYEKKIEMVASRLRAIYD